jgi:hypothetical protein
LGDKLNEKQHAQLDSLYEKREAITERSLPKVTGLLSDFHQTYPNGNFIASVFASTIRIEPADVQLQSERSSTEQSAAIDAYQKELKAFGEFLKEKYFTF